MYTTKILLSSALYLFLSVGLMAQSSIWSIGIEGGPAISSLRGNKIPESIQKPRLASSAGLSLQYQINQRFSLKTGLMSDLKGAKYDVIFYDALGQQLGNGTLFYNYQYLTVPLQLKADLAIGPSLQGFVSAGPYASYLMSITQSFPDNQLDYRKSHKDIDAGLVAGLGIIYHISSKFSLTTELRNQLGLTNVSRVPLQNEGVIKHNAAQLLFGLQYRLNGVCRLKAKG